MCNVCGCGQGEMRIEGRPGEHHHHHSEHDHSQHHPGHAHHHTQHQPNLNFGQGPARAHAPGLSQTQMVRIEQDILSKNDGYAEQNREYLTERGVLTLNLVSSPGSGKTTLLTATIRQLKDLVPVAVIEGDQETANDAERIRETGATAVQINTGRGCHLDAHMVGHALERLPLEQGSVLFIENVGNLVCPASFALGEDYKVVILSVAEGEDKPLKYPDMFAVADLMILNKIDLLPYVDFDVERCTDYARRVNPGIEVFKLSARSGEGMTNWIDWISVACSPMLSVSVERPEGMHGEIPQNVIDAPS